MSPLGPDWPTQLFDDTYDELILSPSGVDTRESIERTADALWRTLRLEPGGTLFDQCCGAGRMSLPLARRGVRVVGVDLNASYVARAQAASDNDGLSCRYFHADATEFTAPEPCDAGINWFTSIGYDRDGVVTRKVLARAFASLRRGGVFVVDYLGVPWALANGDGASLRRHPRPSGEILAVLETRLDLSGGVLELHHTFIYPDGSRQERRGEIRLLLPHELIALLRDVGFSTVELMGSASGAPFTVASPRCVLVARR